MLHFVSTNTLNQIDLCLESGHFCENSHHKHRKRESVASFSKAPDQDQLAVSTRMLHIQHLFTTDIITNSVRGICLGDWRIGLIISHNVLVITAQNEVARR